MRHWLEVQGFSCCLLRGEDHVVSDHILPLLTRENLGEMGVTAVGDRRRLLDATGKLQPAASAPPARRSVPPTRGLPARSRSRGRLPSAEPPLVRDCSSSAVSLHTRGSTARSETRIPYRMRPYYTVRTSSSALSRPAHSSHSTRTPCSTAPRSTSSVSSSEPSLAPTGSVSSWGGFFFPGSCWPRAEGTLGAHATLLASVAGGADNGMP